MKRNRFFAQYMFARLRRLQCPFHVLACRQWNIDTIHLVGLQQVVIGAECMRRTKTIGQITGACEIAAGNGRNDAVAGILHGRNELFTTNSGCR